MLPLPGHLVHADVVKAVQTVGIELVIADTLDDPPDRVPIDPQHPLDRRLVRPGRQPRDQALEVARELRPRPGERDALGPRTMNRAPQPAAPAMHLEPPDPEIQMAPDRVLRPRVLARRGRVPALRADQPAALERHLDDHPLGLEPNLPHPHAREAQKPGKCRRDAHAVPPCKPLTFRQPAACTGGRRRVANQRATCEDFLSRRKACSNPESRSHPDHIDAGRPENFRLGRDAPPPPTEPDVMVSHHPALHFSFLLTSSLSCQGAARRGARRGRTCRG